MTSSIARMNCFLHGIEDFRIVRGDTLAEPKFVRGRPPACSFDVVLANPPYSIKQWDREAFATDPWGRNLYGTPPQGRADYAFWQHILCSLAPKTGRCAILFPHGVLFRQEEAEMRRKLIEADLIECVLGLGPNLFYNSPMEACVVICRTAKPKARRGKILFINAVNEVTRERAQSFLTDDHIERIVAAYQAVQGRTRLRPRRLAGGNPRQGRQPEHPALRCRRRHRMAQVEMRRRNPRSGSPWTRWLKSRGASRGVALRQVLPAEANPCRSMPTLTRAEHLSACSNAIHVEAACASATWWRTSTRRATRSRRALSGSSGWSIWSRGRCTSGRGATWRTAPRSRAAAGRGRCSSASAAPTSARWPWPSSTRWCPATSTCLAPKDDRLLPELLPFLLPVRAVLPVRGRDLRRFALAAHQLEPPRQLRVRPPAARPAAPHRRNPLGGG